MKYLQLLISITIVYDIGFMLQLNSEKNVAGVVET